MENAVRDNYIELTVRLFYLQMNPEQSSYFRAHVKLFSKCCKQRSTVPPCHGSEYLHISVRAVVDFLF